MLLNFLKSLMSLLWVMSMQGLNEDHKFAYVFYEITTVFGPTAPHSLVNTGRYYVSVCQYDHGTLNCLSLIFVLFA